MISLYCQTKTGHIIKVIYSNPEYVIGPSGEKFYMDCIKKFWTEKD